MDAWISNTAKHMNDHYLKEFKRDYAARSLTFEQVMKRLSEAGYKTWDAGMGVGYSHPKIKKSGVVFSLLPEFVDELIDEATPRPNWWGKLFP